MIDLAVSNTATMLDSRVGKMVAWIVWVICALPLLAVSAMGILYGGYLLNTAIVGSSLFVDGLRTFALGFGGTFAIAAAAIRLWRSHVWFNLRPVLRYTVLVGIAIGTGISLVLMASSLPEIEALILVVPFTLGVVLFIATL